MLSWVKAGTKVRAEDSMAAERRGGDGGGGLG